MNISLLLFVGLVLFGVFWLGRCSADAKATRMEKENQQLRDMLDKTFLLEKLGAQTYAQIACELAAAYAQSQKGVQDKK